MIIFQRITKKPKLKFTVTLTQTFSRLSAVIITQILQHAASRAAFGASVETQVGTGVSYIIHRALANSSILSRSSLSLGHF